MVRGRMQMSLYEYDSVMVIRYGQDLLRKEVWSAIGVVRMMVSGPSMDDGERVECEEVQRLQPSCRII